MNFGGQRPILGTPNPLEVGAIKVLLVVAFGRKKVMEDNNLPVPFENKPINTKKLVVQSTLWPKGPLWCCMLCVLCRASSIGQRVLMHPKMFVYRASYIFPRTWFHDRSKQTNIRMPSPFHMGGENNVRSVWFTTNGMCNLGTLGEANSLPLGPRIDFVVLLKARPDT